MGCGNSKIAATSPTVTTDKEQPVVVPRPASLNEQARGTNTSPRSGIPVKPTKPRPTAPSSENSPGTENNSLEEYQTPPKSSTKPTALTSPKRVNSRPSSRVSNGTARGSGVTSPTGSISGRNIKVQKRPKSRGTGNLLNGSGGNTGSNVDKSKTLQEKNMNGRNATGDTSNNSSLSAGSSKPLLAASRKVSTAPKAAGSGGSGDGGKNSNSNLTSKPASLELVVVVDPEVEGKTRIPRPRQAYQLVDPRRYIRVAHSLEDLRDGGNGKARSVSAAQPNMRKPSKTATEYQPKGQARQAKPQMQQRPRSMMLMGSPEAKSVGVGSWAAGRGAREAVAA